MSVVPVNQTGDPKRWIVIHRRRLVDASLSYIREGKDGTMRDRLRTASGLSGISERELEAEVGSVDRIRANVEKKS